ncbi:MAG: helix-turn-helix domain-containing protein [Eubacteriales bacterium]
MNNESGFKGYNSIFALRLKGLMEKTTQAQLAEQIGTTRQAVSQYMDGSVQPNIEKLYKISNYFKVSADYLLGSAQCPTPENEAIGKVTGLSEKAILKLKKMNASDDGLSYEDEIILGLDGLPSVNLLLEDDSNILTLLNQYLFSAFEIGFDITGVRAEGMPPINNVMKDVTGFSINVPVRNKNGYYDAAIEDIDPNILRYVFLKQIENRLSAIMEKNAKSNDEYYGRRGEERENLSALEAE